MITYNWDCKTLDCYIEQDGDADVVYNVHWIVTGISDALDPSEQPYSARSIGTQKLNTSDITDFIPFDQLTNEQVSLWTKSAIGDEGVVAIEAGIASKINLLINPISITLELTSNIIDPDLGE